MLLRPVDLLLNCYVLFFENVIEWEGGYHSHVNVLNTHFWASKDSYTDLQRILQFNKHSTNEMNKNLISAGLRVEKYKKELPDSKCCYGCFSPCFALVFVNTVSINFYNFISIYPMHDKLLYDHFKHDYNRFIPCTR